MAVRKFKSYIELRDLHPEASAKAMRNVNKEQLQETIRFWHEEYLPRHFESEGSRRYGYQRRTVAYNRRKLKRFGHQRPLELTGELKRNVLRQIKVSGTSRKARGRLPGSQVANFNRGQGGRPDVRKEMLATTQNERRRMARFHEEAVEKGLKNYREPPKRRRIS